MTPLHGQKSLVDELRQIDYLGNLLLSPRMVAVLWGLIFGGNRYPWSSFRITVPLVLGILGWISFYIQQRFTFYQLGLGNRLLSNHFVVDTHPVSGLGSSNLSQGGMRISTTTLSISSWTMYKDYI